MRRRLNVRLIVWLVIPTILLAACGYGIYKVQIRRNAKSLMQRAKVAEAAGDLAKAEECLRLFLGYRPDYPPALMSYGLILRSKAKTLDDGLAALQILERALRLEPSARDVRRQTAELAMNLGRYSSAQNHLVTLLGTSEPSGGGDDDVKSKPNDREWKPVDGELEYLIAFCSEAEGAHAAAARWYRRAIAHDPQHIDSYVRLAWILRSRLDDPARADKVMDASEIKNGLIAANGESARALLERAFYRKRYQLAGVEADIARALQIKPDEASVLMASALWSIEKSDFQAARRQLTHGLETTPKDWRMADALAWLERRAGRLDEAEKCLRTAIDATNDPHGKNELLWNLADLLIDTGRWQDAPQVIERVSQQQVLPEAIGYLQARIEAAKGQWIEAATELESIYPRLLREPALAYRADIVIAFCYLKLGALDQRFATLKRAIAVDPKAIAGRLGLAQTLEAMGRLDEALAAYREIADQAPGARVDVARVLVQINLRRPASLRDWSQVEPALDLAARLVPDSVEPTILRAEMQAAQGRAERARSILEAARDQHPDRVEYWTAARRTGQPRRHTGSVAFDHRPGRTAAWQSCRSSTRTALASDQARRHRGVAIACGRGKGP